MFNTASFLFQNTTERSNRYSEEYRVAAAARRLYRFTREQARVGKLVARLSGTAPRHLADLSSALDGRHIASRRYAGLQTVALDLIAGSVDRADDFDAELRPLDDSTEQRWLRVATARAEGEALPPVELIQVGNVYFIQDGHHRVSVAKARGEQEIEAEVAEWRLA